MFVAVTSTSTRVLYFLKCLQKKKENQEIAEGEGDSAARRDFLPWESECSEWHWVLGSSSRLAKPIIIYFLSLTLTYRAVWILELLFKLSARKQESVRLEESRICSERRIQSHRSAERRPMIVLHANDTLTDECSKVSWMYMKYTRICLMRFSDFINLRAAVLCWWVWNSFSSCLSFSWFFFFLTLL